MLGMDGYSTYTSTHTHAWAQMQIIIMPDGSGKCIRTYTNLHTYISPCLYACTNCTHTFSNAGEDRKKKKNGFGIHVYAECIRNFVQWILSFRSIGKIFIDKMWILNGNLWKKYYFGVWSSIKRISKPINQQLQLECAHDECQCFI